VTEVEAKRARKGYAGATSAGALRRGARQQVGEHPPPGFANLLPLFVPGQCGEVHYAVPGGRRSNFQHKSLTYRYSDGAITVG